MQNPEQRSEHPPQVLVDGMTPKGIERRRIGEALLVAGCIFATDIIVLPNISEERLNSKTGLFTPLSESLELGKTKGNKAELITLLKDPNGIIWEIAHVQTETIGTDHYSHFDIASIVYPMAQRRNYDDARSVLKLNSSDYPSYTVLPDKSDGSQEFKGMLLGSEIYNKDAYKSLPNGAVIMYQYGKIFDKVLMDIDKDLGQFGNFKQYLGSKWYMHLAIFTTKDSNKTYEQFRIDLVDIETALYGVDITKLNPDRDIMPKYSKEGLRERIRQSDLVQNGGIVCLTDTTLLESSKTAFGSDSNQRVTGSSLVCISK